MGTVLSIESALPPETVDLAFDEVARVENLITSWRPSELTRLNEAPLGEPLPINPELAELLDVLLDWREATDSAFEPATGALLDLWKTRSEGALPQPEALATAIDELRLPPYAISSNRFTRKTSAIIEEGGFGKGYGLDRAAAILEESAPGERALLDFSGQLMLTGDQQGLEVAIADPSDRSGPALSMKIPAGSLATSSGSEKFFEIDGRLYSHIIDPRTGAALPPNGSATVFHQSALVADILSTALYVMGPHDGLPWAETRDIAAIFITPLPQGDGWLVRASSAAQELELRPLTPKFIMERN